MRGADERGSSSPALEALELVGGRLCLDFANTLDPRTGPHPHDFLVAPADLIRWGRHAGVLAESEVQALMDRSRSHPEEAKREFSRAIALREALYRIFSAIAAGNVPPQADLDLLQEAFGQAMLNAGLRPGPLVYEWEWVKSRDGLNAILWPIVHSALDLLRSEQWRRVKECPGLGDCGWLFLDASKNGSRHWCNMQGCGSRAKMRRLYARKRAGSLPERGRR